VKPPVELLVNEAFEVPLIATLAPEIAEPEEVFTVPAMTPAPVTAKFTVSAAPPTTFVDTDFGR
jgi:hypothetical protein